MMISTATDANGSDEIVSTTLSSPELIEWSDPYEVVLVRTATDTKLGFYISSSKHPIRSEETYTIINNIKSDSIADREPGLLVGCRILAVNQIHLIGKSLDEAYRTLASSPPENPLILCLAKPLYLRPGLSISTPHRYSFGNRSPPSQITKFLSVQAQRRRVNSCGEEYQRNRHIMEMENNAPSNQNNGNNSRYHDSHSQSTTASGVSGPRKYSPPSDATISERSGYNHASNANQANYPEHPTSYHRHSEVDGSYGPTNSNDNQSNNNKWRGSSAVSQSNFVNNENANTSANSYNVSRGPIGRNVPVPPVRQSGKVARVSIGGSVSRVTVPTLNDRQRSVSATELTKGVVNSASNSNPPTVTTSRTVVTKGPHGNKAVASRSVSTSAIALGSNGQAKTSITVKTGHRHTMNTVVDMPPKVVRQHKQYLPVTGGTTLVKSNEGEINDRASGNIVTTAKNQISINMRKNISSTSNNDSQSGAYGPKQSSGRIVISTSKRTVINKRKSDPNERGQPKVTMNEGSRSATPTPTHDKSKGFALGSGAQPQEEDSSDSFNYPTAWRQNTKTIKLESSRSDEPLGIDVQVIDDPENHGHSCTIVTKLASNSITTRAKVISVYDRLVSINDLSLEDIPSQSADEIIKTAGRGTWKLVMRQVLTNQEKDAKEVKSMDSTRVEETIQAESALVAEGIITLDDNEDKLSEIRRLAVTDPHQIIWSSSTETIDVAKIDNRLGCKIVPKKRPNNPSSNDMIIQNIVSDSSVDRDGRIHPGDLLVAINNVSLEEKSSIETTKLIEESPSDQFIRLTFKKPIDIRGYGQEEKSTYIEDAEPGVAKLPDQLFDRVGAEEPLSNLTERSDERSVSTESSKAVTQDSIATPELRIIPDTPQSGTSGDFNTAFANASLQRLHSPSSLPVIINSDAGDTGKSDPIFIKPKSPAMAAGNQHKVDQPKPHHTETKEVLPSIIEIKDISEESLAKSLLIEEAFYTALANGNVKASRARCLFLGDKNSGKSSLFRVLSGQMSKVMRKMSLISDADDAMTSDGILARTRSDSLLPPGLDALMDSAGESDEVFRDDIPLRPQRRSSFIRSSNQQGWSPNNSISSESGSTSGNQASGSSSNPQLSDFDRHAGKLIAHALKQLYFRNTNKSKLAECSTWDKRIPYDSVVSYLKSTSSTVTEDLNSTARLRLDFWDISGHKLTRSVHHVHLAKFGVNLIVFNAVSMLAQEEKQLQSLHYWLNSIRTYTTPTTPVLLVGTHGDELSSDDIKNINRQLNKHFMQSFGGQIARSSYDSVMFLVESQHGIKDEGAARLLEKMFDCARRQEYSTHAIPLSWVMFREQLTRLHKEHNIRCVTVSSLRKLARQVCNITSEQEQTQVLEYLHHGRKIIYPGILHGVKRDHVILNTFVIIDTQCVLEAITALIYQPSHCKETKHFQHKWERLTNYAVVDTDLMLHAWKNSKEPSEVLVSLMEALHIIYRIDDNCDFLTSHLKEKKTLQEFDSKRPGLFSSMKPARFIMPYLLKNQMDESFWEVSLDDISFYFDFHGFLPQPIFMYTIIDIMSQRGKNASLTTTICQTGGIFSLFDDIYHFNLQLYAEKCQFKITARCKEGYSAWYLMNELNVMVKNICDKHFPDVFYHCGPACPMDRCLSADQAFNRVHVLKVDFLNPNAALQCGQIRVDEHPHVKEWLPDDNIEATIAALKDRKNEQSLDNHIDHLSQSTHDELCRLLNQHTPSVKDWRWLALELMEITTQQLVRFKLQDSPSNSLLAEWGKKSHSTVQLLIKKLQDIKRDDCVQILSQWIENHF